MSLLRMVILLLVFSLVACGGNGSDTNIDPNADTANADTDGDGLTNDQELNVFFTSPSIADTDGDGISDGDEVNELGFNAASNPYRFNPLIADLPTMAINFETVPDLVLRFTDSAGTNHEFSSSHGGGTIESTTETNSGTVSLTVGIEKGIKIGTSGAAADSKVTASLTGSYTNTTAETTENQTTWNNVTTNGSFATRNTDGASLRVGISLENNSNLTYSLEHITLLTSYVQNNASVKPIATLSYDSSGGGFKRTSFSPGDKSNLLLFSNDNLDLGTALDLLKDARNMIVQPALFELVNADGVPIAFDEGEVDAKTAEVIIDYGIVRPMETYNVAVVGSQGNGSLTVDTLLGSVLNIDYTDAAGLTGLRGVGGEAGSRWVVLVTHNDGFVDSTTLYDPTDASYDISNINVFPSDQLSIIYLTDVDGDGVGIREEVLNGTDPEKADTDGDGITDDVEIRSAILVNSINLIDSARYPAYVLSNPVLADADGDKLNDLQERERGLDPNNPDTDGDGIGDFTDNINGQLPIAANFTLSTAAKDAVSLTGAATGEIGTTITSISVDWGDGNIEPLAVGSATSLNINFSHTYATLLDSNFYTITIVVTNNNGTTVTYSGDVKLYQELTLNDYNAALGWQENIHIRELVDVDGDNDLDIVGFGGAAVQVSLWNGSGFGAKTTWLANEYSSQPAAGGFSKTEDPRFVIDYDNDGLKDIVAYAPNGIVWSKNMGGAFAAPTLIDAGFNSGGGWNSANHVRTMADVDGNGTPDFIGFGDTKVFIYLSGGVASAVIDATSEFTVGWDTTKHYRFVKDVDGDGRADIVGFGQGSMFTSLGQSNGTFAGSVEFKTGAVAFTNNNGWRPTDYPIYLEDINNDSKPDIVGFGYAAVLVMLNESTVGNVAFSDPVIWNSGFTRSTGWLNPSNKNPRFITDTNNDGYKDVAGFGATVVFAAENKLPEGRNEFNSNPARISSSFDVGSNWQSGGTYNSRYVRDINNDGRADILGFGNAGVITQRMPAITQPVEQP